METSDSGKRRDRRASGHGARCPRATYRRPTNTAAGDLRRAHGQSCSPSWEESAAAGQGRCTNVATHPSTSCRDYLRNPFNAQEAPTGRAGVKPASPARGRFLRRHAAIATRAPMSPAGALPVRIQPPRSGGSESSLDSTVLSLAVLGNQERQVRSRPGMSTWKRSSTVRTSSRVGTLRPVPSLSTLAAPTALASVPIASSGSRRR